MEVSIREMKNHLSKYLRLVRAGKDVVITNRGAPVARLLPIGDAATEADILARIEALPWVQPGRGGKPKGLRKGIRLRGDGPSAAEIVLRDRE
ncbi:type II toxin-antitoxin system Phd/YefM family antitoxin [Pelomicrobium methylotrophicum]|uniref:Antitoxin n=1 Tax=Pelomicrobium methylotrophicum TaxID=2602750 RepID=A0A5C7EDX7_9PROT|nr:type II toxin-antitoxin system prevent-host-death family antitoxin [Pelomicrobium methylotrophicum]TXF10347.1 type II toxin-antitoxin system prevent-host-death family antitoxin [Pelomicrobium methylotrophicum]